MGSRFGTVDDDTVVETVPPLTLTPIPIPLLLLPPLLLLLLLLLLFPSLPAAVVNSSGLMVSVMVLLEAPSLLLPELI